MPEQLFGIGIGTTLPPDQASLRLTDGLALKGYSNPPSTHDPDGEYLSWRVFARQDGGTWLVVEDQSTSLVSLAIELSRAFSQPFDVVEVSAVDSLTRNSGGEMGYKVTVRACQAKPDGTLGPSVLPNLDDSPDLLHEEHGDFHETVSHILINTLEDALPPAPGPSRGLAFHRARSTHPLSQRLQGILADVLASTAVTLQTIDGHQFLKLALPSGNRLARVSAEELGQLRIASPKVPAEL